MPENTDSMAEKSPAERLAEKNKQATLQTEKASLITPTTAPVTPAEAAATGQAVNEASVSPATPTPETAEGKPLNIGQSENANGEQDNKRQFEKGTFEVQGHTKITREESTPDTGKPSPADVVQTGGGGAIDAKGGAAVAGGQNLQPPVKK